MNPLLHQQTLIAKIIQADLLLTPKQKMITFTESDCEITATMTNDVGGCTIATIIFTKSADGFAITRKELFNDDHIGIICRKFQQEYSANVSVKPGTIGDFVLYSCLGFIATSRKHMERRADSPMISSDFMITYSGDVWGNFSFDIIGCALDYPRKKIGFVQGMLFMRNYYFVKAIEISDETLRGKGTGRILMQIIMNLAIYENLPIRLESVKSARGFYEKLGFACDENAFITYIIPMIWRGQSNIAIQSKL